MLRDYQIELAEQGAAIINKFGLVYFAFEMRVGKTLTAMQAVQNCGANNVLFLTKKKAISSIESDFKNENFNFDLTVKNYEQAKHIKPIYDFVILDEAHSLGALGRPNQTTQLVKEIAYNAKLIYLSGTPTPETYSQIYNQLWISKYNPFEEPNFYKWAHKYIDIRQMKINGYLINDYKRANVDLIMEKFKPYIMTYTREEAGFQESEVIESIIELPINPNIEALAKRIIKDRVFIFKDGSEIVCDTAVKLQNKLHQIYSGTVKTESGDYKILDITKVKYIQENYKDSKIAIFYKFIAEGKALKQTLTNWTESPEEFNNTKDKIFISQIQSGSMGVNLSSADILIFYNIDFSAVQYWQARARIQTLKRTKPALVHWLFSKNGIEKKVFEAVKNKKDYTNYYFKKDYGIKNTIASNQIS